MPALVATGLTGTVTWLGAVPHRDAAPIETDVLSEMPLTFAGYDGDCHSGLTRPSCSRVTTQYARGTEIRNTRQLSLVSAEEMAGIAATLGLDEIDPAWLGASVVIAGLPDFTHLPPASRLQFSDGATVTVDMLNQPCKFPALTIERAAPGHGRAFMEAAKAAAEFTGWVEREGVLRIGDSVELHVPGQRAWRATAA